MLKADLYSTMAEKYGQRPSEFVRLVPDTVHDRAVFDQCVMLWANGNAMLDHFYAAGDLDGMPVNLDRLRG